MKKLSVRLVCGFILLSVGMYYVRIIRPRQFLMTDLGMSSEVINRVAILEFTNTPHFLQNQAYRRYRLRMDADIWSECLASHSVTQTTSDTIDFAGIPIEEPPYELAFILRDQDGVSPLRVSLAVITDTSTPTLTMELVNRFFY